MTDTRQDQAAEKLGTLRAALQRSFRVWSDLAANGKAVTLPPAQAQQIADHYLALLAEFDTALTLMDVALIPVGPSLPKIKAAPRLRLATSNGEPQ